MFTPDAAPMRQYLAYLSPWQVTWRQPSMTGALRHEAHPHFDSTLKINKLGYFEFPLTAARKIAKPEGRRLRC